VRRVSRRAGLGPNPTNWWHGHNLRRGVSVAVVTLA